MRPEAGELLDVPSGDIHEDRLRGVVEVEARRDVVRVDVAGGAVQRVPAEHPAVAARDRLGVRRYDVVHPPSDGVLIAANPMLDPEGPAEGLRMLDPFGPVRGDPLVHGDGDELDIPPRGEDVMEEDRRRAAVLPAGEADRDPLPAEQLDLAVDLPLHPPLHEIAEVGRAEVLPAVPDQRDGRRLALRALHGPRDDAWG